MRFAFTWPKALACLALVLIAAVPASASAATSPEIEASKASALQWIRAQQDPASGEIGDIFSGDWIPTALAAAGVNPADVRVAPGNPSLQDFLLGRFTDAEEWVEPLFPRPVTDFERATLSAYAAGLDPARLSAQQNLPAQIAAVWNPRTGSFGDPSTNGTAFALLALSRTPLPSWTLRPAVAYLRRNQHYDGGWNFGPATTPVEKEGLSTVDMTGAAIAAFCEAGVPAYDEDVAEGIEFLHAAYAANAADDGGFEYPFGGPNADTNAWAVSGLTACGVDSQSTEWTTTTGKTPIDFLLSTQEPTGADKGAFKEAFGTPNLYSTQAALRAISGSVFTATPPSFRAPPTVAAGTPVPHTLALDLGAGNVRFCRVVAPAGAPLTAVLNAAKTASTPAGCIGSVGVSGGEVSSIDGITPAEEGNAWLVRLDRGQVEVAAEQPVAFGDVISLRTGVAPGGGARTAGPAGALGPAGTNGKRGKRGKRGPRGRPGRNADVSCRVKHRGVKRHVQCSVKYHHQRKAHRAAQR